MRGLLKLHSIGLEAVFATLEWLEGPSPDYIFLNGDSMGKLAKLVSGNEIGAWDDSLQWLSKAAIQTASKSLSPICKSRYLIVSPSHTRDVQFAKNYIHIF